MYKRGHLYTLDLHLRYVSRTEMYFLTDLDQDHFNKILYAGSLYPRQGHRILFIYFNAHFWREKNKINFLFVFFF